MAMNAEPSDAPDWLTRKHRNQRPLGLIIGLGIGCLITYAALDLAGRAMPKPTAVGETILRDKPADTAGNAPMRPMGFSGGSISRMPVEPPVETERAAPLRDPQPSVSSARQTTFNDQNFKPRGASNVVSLDKTPRGLATQDATPQKMKVTVVGHTSSMKDRACWPYRAGSIEQRNCRSAVGLRYRD